MQLFGLNEHIITSINSVFEQYQAIEKVIVYGSRAKGNYKNGSDIDLTIIDTNLTLTQLLAIEKKLDDLLLPYKIDLSQRRTIANRNLLEHITRVGKLFYTQHQ